MDTSTPPSPTPASFFIDDLADGDALTLDDLDLFLAEERLNAELAAALDPAENIDDSLPPPPSPTTRDVSGVSLSSFETRFKPQPDTTFSVAQWLGFIRDGQAAAPVAQIRDARGTPAYDLLKKRLRTVTWAGTFGEGRKANDPVSPSGLIFLELDHHDGAPPVWWPRAEKMRLASNPGVVASYISAGGAGLHVIAAVDPVPNTPVQYSQAWAWLTRELAIETSGDPQVKNRNRLAAVSHDPDLYQNLTPVPIAWEPAAGGASAGKSERTHTPGDLAEAFRRVAAHFDVVWDGASDEDCQTGLRMPCVYHGGDNPTSLHVWLGQRIVTDKHDNPKSTPTLFAKCHSRDCPGPVVLRFLARQAGINWPLTSGIFWPALAEDALADTLALVRIDFRVNRTSGQIEVRPWPGFVPDRILTESCVPFRKTGWADIGGTTFDKAVRMLARRSFKLEGTIADWDDAFIVGATASPYTCYPFVEYLENLPPWDGTQRLYTLFADALGAPDTNLNRFASTGFMLGAVMRSVEPGCVHDWMAILVGEQGLGKSRFCRALLPLEFQLSMFAEDLSLEQEPQKIAEGIGGALIGEFSEMSGIRGARATEGFKSFISARQDRYRRPYHRTPSDNPRAWVPVGTANEDAVPSDATGSRRYLAVQCGDEADWDYVPENRTQLWSEAFATYQAWVADGSPNPPPNLIPSGLRDAQNSVNSKFVGTDAHFEELAGLLEHQAERFTGRSKGAKILALWNLAHLTRNATVQEGFTPPTPMLDRSAENKFGAALTFQGWARGKFNGSRVWFR